MTEVLQAAAVTAELRAWRGCLCMLAAAQGVVWRIDAAAIEFGRARGGCDSCVMGRGSCVGDEEKRGRKTGESTEAARA